MSSFANRYSDARVKVLVGADAIAPYLPRLMERAAEWDQPDELGDLEYFVRQPAGFRKVPHLVVLLGADDAKSVLGAALLYRYGGLLKGLKVMVSLSRAGRRVVFAPARDRVEVAAVVARYLLADGAHLVSIDLRAGGDSVNESDAGSGTAEWQAARALVGLRLRGAGAGEWALERQARLVDLPLAKDYESALATLGKRTRRNMRHYRRLCEEETGCRFEPEVEMGLEEFLAMNAKSAYKADRDVAVWRYESMSRFANTFLAGLRDRDGRWMSVLGGRRSGGTVEIDWQMNRKDLARYSLVTVMRGYLMEHEINRGSDLLMAEGGTMHSMARSFRSAYVYNVAARRRSVRLAVLEWLLARWAPAHGRKMFRAGRVWRNL